MNYLRSSVSVDFTLPREKHLTTPFFAPLVGSCLLCGNDSDSSAICNACAAELPCIPEQHCPRCNIPTPLGEICGGCLASPPPFAKTTAAFHYTYPLDRLIQALKYSHRTALANWFAIRLISCIGETDIDVVLPMPLHPKRLQERGFNQSAEIARHLAHLLNKPLDRSTLLRTKSTQPQAGLRLKERAKNIRNAFECRDNVTGKHLLLVDDVMTSGATVREASRVLAIHGAASIHVAVVARAY